MAVRLVTGLDIGTSLIKAVVAEYCDGKLIPQLVLEEPSLGFRRGAIFEIRDAVSPIHRVLQKIESFGRSAPRNLYLSVGTVDAKAQHSRGIVAVSRSDTEIYDEDIRQAVKASEAVNLSPNRTIVHTITKEFVVDGIGNIEDPSGLSGNRLEAVSLVIDVFSPHIKNLVRAVELAGGEMRGLAYGPLMSSRSSLSKRQKELGVVLIDIGAGTTGLAVYEENKLMHVAKFPIGASHISNDIAIGLRIPVDAAERLKLEYGYAIAQEIGMKEVIRLQDIGVGLEGMAKRRFVAEIIEARLAEILQLVNNELKLIGRAGKLPGGAVIVGGGAKLPGFTSLVKRELRLTTQIGSSSGDEWAETGKWNEYFEDPEYAGALGLALWGAEEEGWRKKSGFPRLNLKNILRYFTP